MGHYFLDRRKPHTARHFHFLAEGRVGFYIYPCCVHQDGEDITHREHGRRPAHRDWLPLLGGAAQRGWQPSPTPLWPQVPQGRLVTLGLMSASYLDKIY